MLMIPNRLSKVQVMVPGCLCKEIPKHYSQGSQSPESLTEMGTSHLTHQVLCCTHTQGWGQAHHLPLTSEACISHARCSMLLCIH